MNIFSVMPQTVRPDVLGSSPAAEQASRSNLFASCLTSASGKMPGGPGGLYAAASGTGGDALDTAMQALGGAREEFGLPAEVQTQAAASTARALARGKTPVSLNQARTLETIAATRPSVKRTTPQQLKITGQDFSSMRQGLLDSGLSETEVKGLEDQVLSHGGLTWGEFVHALSSRHNLGVRASEMPALDRQQLSGFFSKLGFTPQETEGLIKDLSEKRLSGVVTQVNAKMGTKTPDTYLSLTSGELKTFAAYLSLSKDGTKGLESQLAGTKTLSLDEARNALALAGRSLVADKTARSSSDVRLAELVGQTLKEAMKTENAQRQSERLGGESKERRMRHGAGISREIGEVSHGQAQDPAAVAKDSPALGQAGKGRKDAEGLISQMAGHGSQGQDASGLDGKGTGQGTGQGTGEQALQDPGRDRRLAGADRTARGERPDEDKAWKEFVSRLRLDESAPAHGRTAADGLAGTLGLREATQPQAAPAGTEAAAPPAFLRQIQDAVLKDLGQGTKQLTLQLTPEDLGTVNVVLQVRGKEVHATISAENQDTVALITERMDTLRQALEEQGLKVSRLEVRSSLADARDFGQWSGAESHNRSQEEEAMARWANRLRGMRPEGASLAQEMQTMDGAANLSRNGLHVIA